MLQHREPCSLRKWPFNSSNTSSITANELRYFEISDFVALFVSHWCTVLAFQLYAAKRIRFYM